MLKSAVKRLLRLLPHTRRGDFLHMLVFFVYAQRRLPRRGSGLFNDWQFFLKTGGELTDPLRQVTSDKVTAKLVIDQLAGRPVTPRTYAVFSSVEEIERAPLPGPCVLKPAHASGYVVFVEDPARGLTEAERGRLRQALAADLYAETREINYKYLRRRIICEELIAPPERIKDYKVLCFEGAVRLIQVDWDRHGAHRQNFYDRDWRPIHITYNDNPPGPWEPEPAAFAEMKALCERIARHFGWVRIDLYLEGDRLYVGELTHCHNQAHGVFGSREQERAFSRILFG